MRGQQQYAVPFGNRGAQVMFAIEGKGEMFGVAGEDGDAINDGPAKRQEMPEDKPAGGGGMGGGGMGGMDGMM